MAEGGVVHTLAVHALRRLSDEDGPPTPAPRRSRSCCGRISWTRTERAASAACSPHGAALPSPTRTGTRPATTCTDGSPTCCTPWTSGRAGMHLGAWRTAWEAERLVPVVVPAEAGPDGLIPLRPRRPAPRPGRSPGRTPRRLHHAPPRPRHLDRGHTRPPGLRGAGGRKRWRSAAGTGCWPASGARRWRTSVRRHAWGADRELQRSRPSSTRRRMSVVGARTRLLPRHAHSGSRDRPRAPAAGHRRGCRADRRTGTAGAEGSAERPRAEPEALRSRARRHPAGPGRQVGPRRPSEGGPASVARR